MKLIEQGAEAKLFRDKDKVIKERVQKLYRHPQIDQSLRRFRTRREAKVLSKLNDLNFPAPRFHDFCDKRMTITMDFLEGKTLRETLEDKNSSDEYKELANRIGKNIGELHKNDIIHGDLTTSNMINTTNTNNSNDHPAVKFIDFGLSKFTNKDEDKAVDLHLLDRALESKHNDHYPELFKEAISGYKISNPNALQVLDRLKKVQKRGRNKK